MDQGKKKYRTYNTTHPRMTIRFHSAGDRESIVDAAKRAGISASEYILERLQSPGGQPGGPTTIDDRSREDITFLLHLFQRNAQFLTILPEERERVRHIIQRLKQ